MGVRWCPSSPASSSAVTRPPPGRWSPCPDLSGLVKVLRRLVVWHGVEASTNGLPFSAAVRARLVGDGDPAVGGTRGRTLEFENLPGWIRHRFRCRSGRRLRIGGIPGDTCERRHGVNRVGCDINSGFYRPVAWPRVLPRNRSHARPLYERKEVVTYARCNHFRHPGAGVRPGR